MDWRAISLHGATGISRVTNVYEVQDLRVPGTRYRIKVLERVQGDFLALPNMCVKNSGGEPEWISGLGRTEVDALQDAVSRTSEMLVSAARLATDDFEWSDPRDF
ncbi:hypothetical protein HPC49_35275 [Pyxidicoccus fallax]|uniref:Uncharacterized protein n=1 Tax=Pyxidicoccus fallax TaxID=394095 RepID=A0A848LPX0_9BACT|nr:hypothetical protein [Pyxidicoccus fallax]NMO19719.1 hypothetical protein [Pyxidicoccus fallax]NPC83473.1 hypothetical protein [Pyxidicoccus fallax]